MLSLIFTQTLISQDHAPRRLPKPCLTAQYAGSTGLYSLGFSLVSRRDKAELGLLYGRLPRAWGGLHQTLVLKLTYNPFRIRLTERLNLEPLQTGLFVNQNFNRHLDLRWGSRYPHGYYWWTRSTRFHFFLGTQASCNIARRHIDRLALYFEANTNDLYLFSYLPNTAALSPYDIFFFGCGVKVYVR